MVNQLLVEVPSTEFFCWNLKGTEIENDKEEEPGRRRLVRRCRRCPRLADVYCRRFGSGITKT
jgi:hypothetical protein